MKQFNTRTSIMDTGPITSAVITGGIFIAAFTNGVGLPVGIASSETSLLFLSQQVLDENLLKRSW